MRAASTLPILYHAGKPASGIKKPMNGGPPVWRDSGRQWPAPRAAAPDLPPPNAVLGPSFPLVDRVPVLEADPVIGKERD
jgi:hypothetical protein